MHFHCVSIIHIKQGTAQNVKQCNIACSMTIFHFFDTQKAGCVWNDNTRLSNSSALDTISPINMLDLCAHASAFFSHMEAVMTIDMCTGTFQNIQQNAIRGPEM